jgi:hypothetical protein
MLTTQAGDARLAAWWAFMAAHALLVQRVGRDLAKLIGLDLDLGPPDLDRLRPAASAPHGRCSSQ